MAEIFRLTTATVALPAVGGMVAGVFAFRSLRKNGLTRNGLFISILCVLALGILFPGMARDRIEVSPQKFRMNTGFWFAPTIHEFDPQQVDHVEFFIADNRQFRKKEYMRVFLHDGTSDPVPVNTLFRDNQARIIELLESYGVRFANHP